MKESELIEQLMLQLRHNKIMEKALVKIMNWELPKTNRTGYNGSEMSYGAAYGSNGERDYIKMLAKETLTKVNGY